METPRRGVSTEESIWEEIMRNLRYLLFVGLALVLFVVACDSYSQTGVRSSNVQDMSGGRVTTSISKANGTTIMSVFWARI